MFSREIFLFECFICYWLILFLFHVISMPDNEYQKPSTITLCTQYLISDSSTLLGGKKKTTFFFIPMICLSFSYILNDLKLNYSFRLWGVLILILMYICDILFNTDLLFQILSDWNWNWRCGRSYCFLRMCHTNWFPSLLVLRGMLV